MGGAQIRFASLANRFGPRWRHAILSLDGNLACRENLSPSLSVSFPEIRLPKGRIFSNLPTCRRVIRDLAPSVMVTTNWGSIEWAMANLLPLVPHIHVEEGLGPDEMGRQHWRRIWGRRLALRRSMVVVPSHGLERMATGSWGVAPQRLRRIPNGVDLARFRPSGRSAGSPLTIGTVAALRPEKNIHRLLKAFRLLRDGWQAKLVIVGGGGELGSLQAAAQKLGVSEDVTFTGPTARPEEHYARFDIFAVSSDTEQMPLSVLEAMASGLPVVSTDVGDVRLMLPEENLPFVVPKSADAIARALANLARDEGMRLRLGVTNRRHAEENFDQERSLEAWGATLDEAARSSSAIRSPEEKNELDARLV
ncbi:glycosyltransferase family 4 protein [Sabulicella rubraurantiaca]|uniref:glycosyltransferase family 4 protein n=1 Tax=Sabulicella rubraurantiaca TaxID=2811429 RepID=UPI002E290F98|nr:glycosyltransferase family 4 protein [Sabulicella rubraurantiaca]